MRDILTVTNNSRWTPLSKVANVISYQIDDICPRYVNVELIDTCVSRSSYDILALGG